MTISVWYGDGPDAARTGPLEALAAAGIDADPADVEVTLGWTIEPPAWLDPVTATDADRCIRSVRTVLAGYGLAKVVNAGRVSALPVRLSAVPSLIAAASPDLAVLSAVRRGDRLAFGASVGWADVLARSARHVVVEVAGDGVDLGAAEIDGPITAVLDRPSPTGATRAAASRPADEVDLTIGRLVASLLPPEPTLQFGPGGIGEGIARALEQPVRIWSGLVTDAMASLWARGLLLDRAVSAYSWGGEPIRALADAGRLTLASCTTTHDLSRLSAMPRFVGCNTAIQVGLDGAVNVERAGARIIAAVGGHADFCAGASRSAGGLAVVALRSTTQDGSSTIVPTVEVVSTARCDVQVVVTEHGVADLRGADDTERARRLAAVAAPEHRAALLAEVERRSGRP